MTHTIAFIGLGAMGSEMAGNLLGAGYTLRVFNRTADKAKALADTGATACPTIAQCVSGADFVVSMVSDDEAAREVMLSADGVIEAAGAGAIILDCSTLTPAMSRACAAAARARSLAYLDAPVSGSIAQARARELVFMVGGDAGALAKAQDVLAAMGRMVRHMGESGSGATIKLINNMLSGTASAALAEALAVGEAAGLEPGAMLDILGEGAAGSRLLRSKLPKMTGRDFTPQFQLGLMEKDLRYFLTLAQQMDRPAPLAALVGSQYQAARLAGLGKLDVAALFQHVTGERPPESTP